MPRSKYESSDEEWVERDNDDGPEERQEVSDLLKDEKLVEKFDKKILTDTKERKKEKDGRSAETSTSRPHEEKKGRHDSRHHTSDRYSRREDTSKRECDKSDESRRSKKYDDIDRTPNKKPRREDVDSDRMERLNQERDRDSSRRRDGYHSRGRDDRERFQRKDDRRGYGAPRRGYRSGGNGDHYGGRGRNEDRERWREKERRNEREDRSTWDIRPSAEEVAKQKKLLWGKSTSQANEEEGSGCGDHGPREAATASSGQQKNVGLWSSAITACGVGGDQANKFLKLMGIKNAPTVNPASEDNKRLQEESEKQRKVMQDLDRQYEIAREATHMGRGLGLGFHQ
ncbi:hypothetical protein Angca_007065 [Angiostrongylus cantonensis]|nr:hypothetical protein Angca_007065 [Angiostrongylus cantonensis]